jgi:PAS domain S-box-containing protein
MPDPAPKKSRATNAGLPTEAESRELSAIARTSRLEWLLQGVLDIQVLVTEAAFDLDSFLQRVVDLAEELTEAKGAVVERVEGEEIVYRAVSRSIRQHLGLRLQRGSSLSGLCVATGQVLRCDDAEQDSRVDQEACRTVGVRSMLCTPLYEAGRAVGVLKVLGSETHAFDSDDQSLLSLLAGALGAALGRQLVIDELRGSEEIFRTAMEMASIGMALVKPDGRFLKVNAALCELMGYDEADLLANDFQSITHPEDLDSDLKLVQSALAGDIDRYRLEKRYYHKTGRIVWVLLSVSLVRNRAGLPSYFITQIQDIGEQREMERIKNEFISIVSHELRTPLTSIRGSLGLLLGTQAGALPAKVMRLLDIANGNCERLIRLVNDILDIDKIASGSMCFDMQEVAVTDIMQRAVQGNEAYAQRFNVRLALIPSAEQLAVEVDADRLLQVLSNLLSNAVKFSPAQGEVELGAQRLHDCVRINVVDHGPGIPENFRERIFGKFSQADSSSARRAGGTGLGLHISRQILEHMRGRIGFDTEVGHGTTFWIELPSAC